jgi:hypothetical protein
MIKLRAEMEDPKVQEFFRQIDDQIVGNLLNGKPKLSVPRTKKGTGGEAKFRTGPILNIADKLSLFDHIELPQNREALFPQIPTGFNVARAGDEVVHTRSAGGKLKYQLDDDGNCRFTFRWSKREAAAQGGAAGRARGKRDALGEHQYMEPTIYVEKYDPETGLIMPDKNDDRNGNWRAFMVTFPLREPIREIESARIALPTELCAYDYQMTEEERTARSREKVA